MVLIASVPGHCVSFTFYNGEEGVITFTGLFLIGSFFILEGYHDTHKSLHEFEIWPYPTTDYGVN